MKIVFLGVDGWYNGRGRTPCVVLPEFNLALDAGTGLCYAGSYLEGNVNILLSHTHFDHITGLAGMKDNFNKNRVKEVTIHTPNLVDDKLYDFFKLRMTTNIEDHSFPVNMVELKENLEFGNVKVESKRFNRHPGSNEQVAGFRISYKGESLTYLVDLLISDETKEFARDSNLLIHDCYLPNRYAKNKFSSPKNLEEFLKYGVQKIAAIHPHPKVYKHKLVSLLKKELKERKFLRPYNGKVIEI